MMNGTDTDDRQHPGTEHATLFERPATWVALAGFMGTGKSRIGWELSRRLGLTFIDTDRVVERISNMRITDIFEAFGEQTFREYETEVVRRSLRLDNVVVSTGGGTVLRPANRKLLKSRGPVVVLQASPETIFRRTRRHRRPLLETEDPEERIRQLLAERRGAYQEAASILVSTDRRQSSDVVEEIVEKLWIWSDGHGQGIRDA